MKFGNNEIRIWKCKFCGREFDTVQGLSIHLGIKQKEIEKTLDKDKSLLLKLSRYYEIKEEKERLKKFYPKWK